LVERSFFYWLTTYLIDKFAHFFRHSLVGRVFSGLGAFLGRIWRGSWMHHIFLGDFSLQRGFGNGVSGKALAGVGGLATKSSAALAPHMEQSRILSWFKTFCDGLPHISLRSFGIMLLLMGAIPSAANFIMHQYVPLLMGLIALIGLPLLPLNRSFAQLHHGSWVMQKTLRFFFVDDIKQQDDTLHYLPLFVILGLAFGLAAAFLDLTTFIILLGGTIGGILVLYRTEFGIFTAAFLIPLVPTMMVLGLLAVTVLSFAIKVFVTGTSTLKFSAIDVFVLIFGVIVAHSLIISYNTASSAPVVAVYLLYILFYFVVKNTMASRQKIFAALSLIAVSGLGVAAFGVWQRLTGNFVMTEAWVDAEFFDQTMVRIYSTLENPNVLGEYLIFVIIIAFGMLYYFREYLHKAAAAGILAVAGLCMIYTQSRGAWMGLIFAFGIYALVRDRRLVVLGLLGLLAAPFIIPPEVLFRFLSIGDLTDTSTSFRVSIWMGSLDMIRVFWPMGIGLGEDTFNMIYNLYAFSAARALHSHNLYMQLIIDLGIGGLITFFLTIGCFVKGLFVTGTKHTDKTMRTLAAVIVAGMLGYLLQGITDNVWFNYRILAFFWLMLALGAAAAKIEWRAKNEQTQV